MKILAVDASTNVAGCAVLSEQKLIAEDLVNYKLKHSEKLMPAISSVMDSSGLPRRIVTIMYYNVISYI